MCISEQSSSPINPISEKEMEDERFVFSRHIIVWFILKDLFFSLLQKVVLNILPFTISNIHNTFYKIHMIYNILSIMYIIYMYIL